MLVPWVTQKESKSPTLWKWFPLSLNLSVVGNGTSFFVEKHCMRWLPITNHLNSYNDTSWPSIWRAKAMANRPQSAVSCCCCAQGTWTMSEAMIDIVNMKN